MADLVPHAVLSEQLESRINGRRVLAVVFLTFEFDPGFFEQEILPLLLGVPVSHANTIRLLQLEDALRSCAGRVAVYYDANRLVSGDAGSARLDVQRVPVRHRTGVFHPKNILALLENSEPEEPELRERSLLVGALSANLTRSGWWENVEACHFEEIAQGESTRLKEDLQAVLRRLKQRTAEGLEHPAADDILGFLGQTNQRVKRVSQGAFQPHFYSGAEGFADFLERSAGPLLKGACLEVVSPFVDEAASSAPLEELIRRFQPRAVRLMLPRRQGGEAACSQAFYEAVRRIPNVSWGRLPQSLLKRGRGIDGDRRFVHAKLYRFFSPKPKSEFCFVGSTNLTRPAHQKGGNWETGILVEVECPVAPDFWLEVERTIPSDFHYEAEVDPTTAGGTPLMLRFHWDRHLAEAYWDAQMPSPELLLKARGVELGSLPSMAGGRWHTLPGSWADRLAQSLKETSFIEVHGHGENAGLLLVQEDGMSHKPSLLLQLSVAEILRYWAMLTPAQRTAFLEAKCGEVSSDADGAALLAGFKVTSPPESLFDRFAGYFHAFNCLDNEVRNRLMADRPGEADYRLFGRKYDSLSTLLQKAVAEDSSVDDVNRYVLFLCARQLCSEVAKAFPDYWRSRRDDVARLEADLDRSAQVRERLAAGNGDMGPFLDWFDNWFLRRAQPVENTP